MGKLLTVGACYLDTILMWVDLSEHLHSVDHLPSSVPRYPCEDEKLRASRIFQRRGGNCPNTLEVLSQLLAVSKNGKISLALSSVLPSRSSPGTEQIVSSLGHAVDLTQCIYREEHKEPASSYVIRSSATDSRTIVNYNELPEMTCEEFFLTAERLGNELTWCHFEVGGARLGISITMLTDKKGRIPEVTLECMRYLRRRFPAIKISVEVEKPGRAGLEDLAAEANVIFYSKSWAKVRLSKLSSAPKNKLRFSFV